MLQWENILSWCQTFLADFRSKSFIIPTIGTLLVKRDPAHGGNVSPDIHHRNLAKKNFYKNDIMNQVFLNKDDIIELHCCKFLFLTLVHLWIHHFIIVSEAQTA